MKGGTDKQAIWRATNLRGHGGGSVKARSLDCPLLCSVPKMIESQPTQNEKKALFTDHSLEASKRRGEGKREAVPLI